MRQVAFGNKWNFIALIKLSCLTEHGAKQRNKYGHINCEYRHESTISRALKKLLVS